jgi:hypothetical protein
MGLMQLIYFFKIGNHNTTSKQNHYEKKRRFATSLVTHFLVAKDTCNLLYLYIVIVNGQVA